MAPVSGVRVRDFKFRCLGLQGLENGMPKVRLKNLTITHWHKTQENKS